MPELGEVVSGVLAEVLRGRLAADTLTAQLVDAYRQDDTLSMLTVPRVTIKEMSVTLRFAVTALETPPPAPTDVEREAEEWNKLLQERVMPGVFESRLSELRPEERLEIRERMAEEIPLVKGERVQSAISGEPESLIKESVTEVVNRFRTVPTTLRRQIGTITDVTTQVEHDVQLEWQRFLERREAIRVAELAQKSRLQVEINTDELQARPSQSVQEVTLVLSMEDVETAVAEPQLVRNLGG